MKMAVFTVLQMVLRARLCSLWTNTDDFSSMQKWIISEIYFTATYLMANHNAEILQNSIANFWLILRQADRQRQNRQPYFTNVTKNVSRHMQPFCCHQMYWKMLAICDANASEYSTMCMVVLPSCRHYLAPLLSKCVYNISGTSMDIVY